MANEDWRPERMTPDEIRQLASDIVDGRIWLGKDEQSIRSFMVLSFVAPDLTMEQIESIGMVYEYLDKAGERSMNGMPMFMSVKYVHAEDWPLVAAKADEFVAAKQAVKP